MAKLFLSFYLMIIASFGLFYLLVTSFEVISESIEFFPDVNEKMAKGTLMLLDEAFVDLDEQQTQHQLTEYKKYFGSDLSLKEPSIYQLTETQLKRLETGNVVIVELDNPAFINKEDYSHIDEDQTEFAFIYYQHSHTKNIWRVQYDTDMEADLIPNTDDEDMAIYIRGGKFFEGTMHLIRLKLASTGKENWDTVIAGLQAIYGLPMQLISTDTAEFETMVENQVFRQEGDVLDYAFDAEHISMVQKIPDTALALKIGPIEIPWFTRNISTLFFSAIGLSFATTLVLWLWPLWSSLRKIKNAADDIGKGDLSARIAHRKLSPIKNISLAFNKMAEQTQNSIRSQKELTSAVSHELRTPIARMHFSLEMLEDTDDKEEQALCIRDIKGDIYELNSLVEELLNYARFDQKNANIHLQLVEIIPWINNSMDRLLPLALEKSLSYSTQGMSEDEKGMMDARLMTRVLDNLVQNALRHAKSTVEVRLSRVGENYLLSVDDDGDGIPNDKREQVFDAFSRLDVSRDRESGGFGLGLAIVSKIVEAHHGTIIVRDSHLSGARFEVSLPANL